MVGDAARGRCRLFQSAQPRRSFTRVEDLAFRALDSRSELVCECRNTGKPLEEIEPDPLAFEKRPRWTLDSGDAVAGVEMVAILLKEVQFFDPAASRVNNSQQ